MDLQERRSARQRDRYVMRLGCCLVCISLVLALMLPQQRAYAVEPVTMTVVASLAVAYFGACGLTFITQNMDKDALVSSVQRLLQEFLDTELGGISIQDWLGTVWDVAVLTGKIIMGRPLTNELLTFAQWVAQKYAAQVGTNIVYDDKYIKFADGSVYSFTTYSTIYRNPSAGYHAWDVKVDSYGTKIVPGIDEAHPLRLDLVGSDVYILVFYVVEGQSSIPKVAVDLYDNGNVSRLVSYVFISGTSYVQFDIDTLSFVVSPGGRICIGCESVSYGWYQIRSDFIPTDASLVDLSIDRAPSVSYIPEGIEVEQRIALDVGAAPTMDLSQILQQVLEDVLAGTLTSSMEIADAEDVPVDPPAGEITDVDGLGLPALGAALTTRFPFSIPWDISRAVQLLAAPAKTPYFEVDFFEPISDLVGGWKGSTKIVLDFSQYEIIGQVSRWTSTIGFCLMLAGATKRLIWTA